MLSNKKPTIKTFCTKLLPAIILPLIFSGAKYWMVAFNGTINNPPKKPNPKEQSINLRCFAQALSRKAKRKSLMLQRVQSQAQCVILMPCPPGMIPRLNLSRLPQEWLDDNRIICVKQHFIVCRESRYNHLRYAPEQA